MKRNMKRTICALLMVLTVFLLTSCGDTGAGKTQAGNTVSAVLQQQMAQEGAEEKNEPQAAEEKVSSEKAPAEPSRADVDLTEMSSTMVYSEVYNMMCAPQDYIGRTVRMNGQFALYQAYDENGQAVPDQIYYACVIADATACCQQGMEFILEGDAKYPEDYPTLGTDITVFGEFRTYMEGENQYCHLIGARIE